MLVERSRRSSTSFRAAPGGDRVSRRGQSRSWALAPGDRIRPTSRIPPVRDNDLPSSVDSDHPGPGPRSASALRRVFDRPGTDDDSNRHHDIGVDAWPRLPSFTADEMMNRRGSRAWRDASACFVGYRLPTLGPEPRAAVHTTRTRPGPRVESGTLGR